MKRLVVIALVLGIGAGWTARARAADAPITGFWRTIDDKTGYPRSIVRLYDCGEALCGRIVALYTDGEVSETILAPERVASKVKGNPKVAGLDIIWSLKRDGDEYKSGRIMDPQAGRSYSATIRRDAANADQIKVRGSIGPVGRTQTWHAVQAADLPAELRDLDVSGWEPVIVE